MDFYHKIAAERRKQLQTVSELLHDPGAYLLSVSEECLDSYSCKHYVSIRQSNGERLSTPLTAPDIIRWASRTGFPLSPHFFE